MSRKIIILLIILQFLSLIYKAKNYNIESSIHRYYKFKRKDIPIKNLEENLMPNILYAKSIKEGKKKKIIYKKHYDIPKISFVVPVFNKEKYLKSLIMSIQMQDLKEIEIVFINDNSTDKSVIIINNFKKIDKRIKLINNKINMGALYSRAIGATKAKGNYIIFCDSDDIVLKEGISKAYNHITKYNLDIVQFLSLYQSNENIFIYKNHYKYKNVIKQPILSYIFYDRGNEYNGYLWDKLVKKEVVLNSLKYIGEEFIQKRIMIENDLILMFAIFKMAKSFQFIECLGYYYFKSNPGSTSNSKKNPENSNAIINSILLNIKFLYEKTSNSFIDKYFCIFKIKQFFKRYNKILKYGENHFDFMKNLFNTLFDSKFISNKDKLTLVKLYLKIFNIDGSIREKN